MSTDIFKQLDALNAEIAEWERTFEASAYVVRGEIPLPSGGSIVYGKIDNRMRIFVATALGAESPLANASIERRLEAIELLEPLASVLRQKRDDAVERLVRRLDYLRQARGKIPV